MNAAGSLLEERRDALGKVGRRCRLGLEALLDGELGLEIVVSRDVERVLGERDGSRPARQARGQLVAHSSEVSVRDHLIDNAQLERAPGFDRLAEHRQLRGARRPDEPRQEVRAREVWDEADADKACTKVADSAAMRMSQANARENPAPAATPLTAAITG